MGFLGLQWSQVYRTSWWMGLYNSLTPKRHIGWSNAWIVKLLDCGRLTRSRAKRAGLGVAKSAVTYVKDGKRKYHGTPLLRQTGLGPQLTFGIQQNAMHLPTHITTLFVLNVSSLSEPFRGNNPPRTYPPAFGRKLTRLHRLFCKKKPEPPSVALDDGPLILWFKALDWGDLWDDGRMYSVLSWLRGSKHLNLGVWRDAFPRKL